MTFSEDFHLFYFNHCFHLKFLTGHLHKQSGHENLATSVAKVGQTPKAEFFAKKISGFQPLTIFAKKLLRDWLIIFDGNPASSLRPV